MRSLADRLLAMPATRHPMIEAARDALKLPDRNHVPVDGDHWRAACDRFVLPPDWLVVLNQVFDDQVSRADALLYARVPLVPCWIECPEMAIFVSGSSECPQATVFAMGDRFVSPTVAMTMDDAARRAWESGHEVDLWVSDHIRMHEDGQHLIHAAMTFAACTLAALTSPRVTSTRRVLPSPVDRARAARARRRAQAGRPVWSHNVVEFVLPRTALHRGVVKPMESFASMRGHSVVGHWRLIDGVLEPYWVWIDGHDRGNKALGKITKSREVTLPAGVHPKGFFRPEIVGHKGQRLPARRAAP